MSASSQDQEVVAHLQQMYGQALYCTYNAEGRVVSLSANSSPTIEVPPPELPKMPLDGQRRFVSMAFVHGGRIPLKGFPQEICQLTALESLQLRYHSIARLPAEIGQLTHLHTLWLTDSELEELPSEIGQLTNLIQLMLNGNQLRKLPAEIGRLTSLCTFGLSQNQLTELPPEIGHLSRLRFLKLDRNQLAHLPAEIGHLSESVSLELESNQLTELPAEIGQLRHLSILRLKNNRLRRLPAEIGQLSHLEHLELENNQLTELPEEITNLKRLHPLNLDGNPIGELPAEQRHLLGITFEAEAYSGSEPLRVLYDEVLVDYGLFALIDVDGPPEEEEDVGWPFGEELPEWVQAKPNAVCFRSREMWHYPWVRLEAWEQEAPPVRGIWDETCEVSFTSTSGRICLYVLAGEVSRHVFTLGPAGRAYHLRAFRRERQEERNAARKESGIPQGTEQYLLQFWPV